MRASPKHRQQMTVAREEMNVVWWIPPEYWDLTLKERQGVSAQTVEEVRTAFRDYQVFALVRVKMSLNGLVEMQSKEELLKHARFEVGGRTIAPVAPDKVPVALQTMLGAMKPMLSGALGQLGQSMELVVYPVSQDHRQLIDLLKPGSFQFALYDREFHWRTPLASLLPKKKDPKTGETFPGNYDYNPYTGEKLGAE